MSDSQELYPQEGQQPDAATIDNAAAFVEAPLPEGVPFEAGSEQPQEPEQPDWEAKAEEAERKRLEAETRAQQLQQQMQQLAWAQQQQALQQQQQVWQAQEQRAWEQVQQTIDDPVLQRQVMQQWYGQRQAMQAQQQAAMMQTVMTNAFAENLIQRYPHLTPEDRDLLGNDGSRMEAIAARLNDERARYAAEREEREKERRARQAQRIVNGGAPRIGGVGGQPSAPVQFDQFEKGSPEQLAYIMAQPPQVIRR